MLGELETRVDYDLGDVGPESVGLDLPFGSELFLDPLATSYLTVLDVRLRGQLIDGHTVEQDLGVLYLAFYDDGTPPDVWTRKQAAEHAPWGLLKDPDGVRDRLQAAGIPADGFLPAPLKSPALVVETPPEVLGMHPMDWQATPSTSIRLVDREGTDVDRDPSAIPQTDLVGGER